MRAGLTNVGELSVFKDHKVQLLAQPLQLFGKLESEIFKDIAVGLHCQPGSISCHLARPPRLTLTMQILAPAALTISKTSFVVVTSTETHRFVFLRSMSSSSRFAIGFGWIAARSAYDLVDDGWTMLINFAVCEVIDERWCD